MRIVRTVQAARRRAFAMAREEARRERAAKAIWLRLIMIRFPSGVWCRSKSEFVLQHCDNCVTPIARF